MLVRCCPEKHMLLQLTFGGLAVGGALASVPVSMRGLCFTLPYLHGNGSVPGWTAKYNCKPRRTLSKQPLTCVLADCVHAQ